MASIRLKVVNLQQEYMILVFEAWKTLEGRDNRLIANRVPRAGVWSLIEPIATKKGRQLLTILKKKHGMTPAEALRTVGPDGKKDNLGFVWDGSTWNYEHIRRDVAKSLRSNVARRSRH